MGSMTTWDVRAAPPVLLRVHAGMAGESWIGREEDADEERLAELVTAGASEGYGPEISYPGLGRLRRPGAVGHDPAA